MELSHHRPNTRELAHELDINPELLYRWRREFAENNGNSSKSDAEAEIERLRKELDDTRMERDILKKAMSIFSKSDGKASPSRGCVRSWV